MTICHTTMSSHCHNELPALVAKLARDGKRASVDFGLLQFPARFSFLDNNGCAWRANALKCCSLLSPTLTLSQASQLMDIFTYLDGVVFAEDSSTSYEALSTELTKSTTSSLSPSFPDVLVDEDRNGSGIFAGYCVIS